MTDRDIRRRRETAKLIHDRCVEYGDFTLASGAKSSFYCDLRRLTFTTEVVALMDPLSEALREFRNTFDEVAYGGPALGSIPLVTGYVMFARGPWGYRSHPLRTFTVRSERKMHGSGNLIEGALRPGDDAIILEDVTTSGGSGMHAVNAVREFGCHVRGVVTVIDREQGGGARYAREGVPFHRLFTMNEILDAGEYPESCDCVQPEETVA